MASRVAEITADLESAFHGETINYNGEDKVITAERERFQNVINGRYPFVLISGPVVDVESRAHRVSNCMLHYLITFMDDTINDDYSSESTIDPITKVVEDVAAEPPLEKDRVATNRSKCANRGIDPRWHQLAGLAVEIPAFGSISHSQPSESACRPDAAV